jgi:AcrR family transcriptional regulator
MSERRKKKSKKTEKGDQTRAAILEAALAILQERGYEQTTMRAVAERAGVALGNAYYYFHSKEHLIQVFYQRLHDEHVAKSQPLLDKERTLKARLLGVMRLKIETLTPYHQFAGVLFKTAADPESPLNPFAEESDPIREASMRLFEQVVEGSKARIPNDLRAELPYLIWVYHVGVILFWIHDPSPKQRRTYRLIDHTVEMLDQMISLASNPLMRPLRKRALKLIDEIKDVAREDE